ncbi:MAG: serine/threonine protein kinase [Ruminococcus sp.]|nr:serine/threonine protein kinase [Ruminococcus sp.]
MSKIIHTSSRGTVEVFEENSEKRIRRTVNVELPLYETLKNSEFKYLPRIYSVEIAEGKTVVTEEFISGKNLLTANLDEKQIIRAMVQLCAALDFIHGLGIVHRDIKPSNILLSEDGSIRLIDFEAARFVRDGKDKDTRYLGTDGFAPPEQYGFSQTDFRTDIYSAGQTMKILLGSLSAKRKYAKIIRKCTALDPAERYQSAKALADALTNKREKIYVAAVLATAAALLIFTVFVPKESPAENISDEMGIVAEAETSSAETTAVPETEFIAETTTASATSITTETIAEAESVSETSSTAETEISANTAITDENGFPPDWSVPSEVQELIDKYNAEVEAGLTYYGEPENLPEYERGDLLFFPEDENAKILFTHGKAFFKEHRKFYLYYDLDNDGVNEAVMAEAYPDGRPDIHFVYGSPQSDSYTGCAGFWSEYLMYRDFGEEYFLQITGFEKPFDGRYFAVTVGDGKSFNVTEIYTVKDGYIEYIGCGWGETTAVMQAQTLNVNFDSGGSNSYMLYDGKLSVIAEYDYNEYQGIKNGEYSLREMFEIMAEVPEEYQ